MRVSPWDSVISQFDRIGQRPLGNTLVAQRQTAAPKRIALRMGQPVRDKQSVTSSSDPRLLQTKLLDRESINGALCPFLSWVGGKRRLVPLLREHLPRDIQLRRYVEPFLGAASLYLAIRPNQALLSDANAYLISCYRHVRSNPETIARYLAHHAGHHGVRHYYRTRARYNKSPTSLAQAARFIYLNKACFNGIFRVNVSGDFNVPFGRKKSPILPSRLELLRIARLLKKATLSCASFEKTLEKVHSGDFVYLDPPYPPINGTSFFTHYTQDRFSEADQRQLAASVNDLHSRGVLFMMTNADTPLVRTLYRKFKLVELAVTRYVTSSATKHKARELVVRNYSR